jgi:DNA phosphorothioation-dependent restriction protein DptF
MNNLFGFKIEDEKMMEIVNDICNHIEDPESYKTDIYNLLSHLTVFILRQNNLEEFNEETQNDRYQLLVEENLISKDLQIKYLKSQTIINDLGNCEQIETLAAMEIVDELLMQIMMDYSTDLQDIENCKVKFEQEMENRFGVNSYKNKSSFNNESTLKNSYLLYLLDKLSISSREAIQGGRRFSDFDKYMDVERPIRRDLIDTIKRGMEKPSAQLIFLSGSTGDGKSHLLAYLNEYCKDDTQKYRIYNDATASSRYNLTAEDTLEEELIQFSDDKIESSGAKMILAINLGVLTNFISRISVQQRYSKLVSFINKSKILNEESFEHVVEEGNFSLVSFSSYNIVELNQDGVSSKYITEIFDKIGNTFDGNLFYQAYKKDLENGINADYMVNYYMFTNCTLRKKLVHKICEFIVKYRVILSTRHLLDFVYNIIVPPNISVKMESNNIIDLTNNLLPTLLYEYPDRALLLGYFSKNDIMDVRIEQIDAYLVSMNVEKDIKSYTMNLLKEEEYNYWINKLEELSGFVVMDKVIKKKIEKAVIRLLELNGIVSNTKADESFKEFQQILYGYYHKGTVSLMKMYEKVQKAIYKWYGSTDENNKMVIINRDKSRMKIGYNLNLKQSGQFHVEPQDNSTFTPLIYVEFEEVVSGQNAGLHVDYSLFEIINRLLQGYIPNKVDEDNAIAFAKFAEKLVKLGQKNDELYLFDTETNKKFTLNHQYMFGEDIYEFRGVM